MKGTNSYTLTMYTVGVLRCWCVLFGLLSATPYSVLYWRNKMMVMVIIAVVLHFHVRSVFYRTAFSASSEQSAVFSRSGVGLIAVSCRSGGLSGRHSTSSDNAN